MTPPLRHQKILITAGETSGDILGAELMHELRRRKPGLQFYGVGGDKMHAAGLHALGDIHTFPGMGLVEVVSALPRIRTLLKTLQTWAKTEKPALCITIDNQEFSKQLAGQLSADNIPCVQYVAPKVWAWRQGRVRKLQRIFKHILCLFPFEVGFFTRHHLAATYIGHPVARRLADFTATIPTSLPEPPTLALLPGSRRAEFNHHWPLFLHVFQQLHAQNPQLTGVVALENERALALCKRLGWHPAFTVVMGEDRYLALQACTAALTKSGTNNLELALLGVPALVAYRMHPLTFSIIKRLVRVPAISPVNLVYNQMQSSTCVYPEFIQHAANPPTLTQALQPLLTNTPARKTQQAGMAVVRAKLATRHSPAQLAAATIAKLL